MTKRSAVAATKPALSAPNGRTPECPRCGFVGWPGPDSSPHIACGGDPARHQRTPIGGTA